MALTFDRLHCFGQGTKIGVYRWLVLSLIAYVLAHWIDLWAWPPVWNWKATARLTLEKLLPDVLWTRLLNQIKRDADIAAYYGFDILIKSRPDKAYQEWCKIQDGVDEGGAAQWLAVDTTGLFHLPPRS